MMREGLKTEFLVKGPLLFSFEICASAKSQVQSYGRRLINDHKTLLVCEAHHLFAVGIMAASEAVGALPFHQGQILYIHGDILTASMGECILMLPIPFKIKRFSIDQEIRSPDLYRTDSVGKFVYILSKLYLHTVQEGIERLPEGGIFNIDFTCFPL